MKDEILRTAFRYLPPKQPRVIGGLVVPQADPNRQCTYCKNPRAEEITSDVELKPFKEALGGFDFRAYRCICGATFSAVHRSENGLSGSCRLSCGETA